MATASSDIFFNFVDLSRDQKVAEELLAGQKAALHQFGVSDQVVTPKDLVVPKGTFAIIARDSSHEAIGGVRIHTRLESPKLPIESDESPLSPEFKEVIAQEQGLCELRGLWAATSLSGRLISRRMVSIAASACYELGFRSIIAFAHWRSYKIVVAPLGFEMDTRVQPIPYPDDRFRSVVVWHRGGIAALTESAASSLREAQPSLV